jgi:hypothetical protein
MQETTPWLFALLLHGFWLDSGRIASYGSIELTWSSNVSVQYPSFLMHCPL